MIDVAGVCYRFISDLKQAFRAEKSSSIDLDTEPMSKPQNLTRLDDLAARALTVVFGMDTRGRIKKDKARHVVEKLGLIGQDEDESEFELPGVSEDELQAEELVGCTEEESLRETELLRQAFTVFDEDGDGFIGALEVKRVLECLGLANGLDLSEFERMVDVVDLNFDGKVDFSEFELMMMGEKK
ncbi:PREDICTED: calmodulin-like protein 3 [Nelumbo nucifera]|uniref:Calmodulin-like protein 3 n=2 Tax=Nelumbo nucifera TaxID=4432 RepID=A0A1U8AKV2_NELNU|nr:PREDICTED: calmodulin-like protein 3 [Nelumbo nucifera]DAD46123.1 TPA_asm: hypothetical protein HUJ06_004353 [Nelumbo nucifera]